MTCPSKIRDFLIGIEYDAIDDDHGSFCIRRKVTLPELINELVIYMTFGCTFPTFPARANPTVSYAWDFKDKGDVYDEITNELEKSMRKRSNNGSNF